MSIILLRRGRIVSIVSSMLLSFVVWLGTIVSSSSTTTTTTSYWPNATPVAVPYHGAVWQPVANAQPVALPRTMLVLLGQHDGVNYYGLRHDRLAGGGGGPELAPYARLYLQEPDGRYLPLAPGREPDKAGWFMR